MRRTHPPCAGWRYAQGHPGAELIPVEHTGAPRQRSTRPVSAVAGFSTADSLAATQKPAAGLERSRHGPRPAKTFSFSASASRSSPPPRTFLASRRRVVLRVLSRSLIHATPDISTWGKGGHLLCVDTAPRALCPFRGTLSGTCPERRVWG